MKRLDLKSLFLFFLFTIGFMNYPAQECDIWWHLQIGEDILKEHHWPSPDSYSYVSRGREWVIHSWLADCIFYGIYTGFGFNGLTILRYFTHFFVAFVIFLICQYNSVKPEYGLCIAIFALYLVWDREIRPFLFSEIAFVLFYLFVRNPSPSRNAIIGLPILFFLWINIHPLALIITTFILCFLFLSLLLIVANCFQHTLRVNLLLPNIYWYVAAFVAIVFSLIHPEPVSLFQRFINAPTYGTNDWKSPIFSFLDYPTVLIPYLIMLLLSIILMIHTLNRLFRDGKPISLCEWSFALFCLVFSFQYIRTMWVIIFPLTTVASSLQNFKINIRSSHKSRWWIPLIIYIILQFSRMQLPIKPYFPEECMDFWNSNQMQGNLYCDWTWSGYVLWTSNKTAKTFVDTRIEPFPVELFPMASVNPSKMIYDLPALIQLKTEYLLLPLPSCHNVSLFINQKGLANILFQNDQSILLKLRDANKTIGVSHYVVEDGEWK